MMLKKTYSLEPGPSAEGFETYAARVDVQYKRLLANDPEEYEVQKFLEENPCLVPGGRAPYGGSGHTPLHCALIVQPKLPGFRSKKPDFMCFAKDSENWYPTLVEIESPKKRLFTKSRVPRATFTQARHQLGEWRSWFNNPTNVQVFRETYGVPLDITDFRQMKLHMILVYGRRGEFQHLPELSRERASLMPGGDESLMSFDRLSPEAHLNNAISVRPNGNGRYRALCVPPTFELGPQDAERLLCTSDLDVVVARSTHISQTRREFLVRRLPYWRDWASSSGSNFMGLGDRE